MVNHPSRWVWYGSVETQMHDDCFTSVQPRSIKTQIRTVANFQAQNILIKI